MSIFSKSKENSSTKNIFANKDSVNLLNMKNSNPFTGGENIFKAAKNQTPSVGNEEEDELNSISSGSANHSNEQVLPEPKEKVMKYNYEETIVKVAEFRLAKFKNGQSLVKENVSLCLGKDKDPANKFLYFMIRNEEIKINVFEGVLYPKTRLEHFMEKEENWKLWIGNWKKDAEGKCVTEREMVKLQFQTVEDARYFEKVVKDLSE